MHWLLTSFLVLGAVLVLIDVTWLIRFNRMVKRGVSDVPTDSLPRALVVLTLRGADPYLERTLERLAQQSYQNFTLRIIIDSAEDPAWQPVNNFLKLEDRPATEVQILTKRLPTCSLKVSALLQAMSLLEPEYEAVLQIDADAVPYANWVRDMLTPLTDHQVGAVSGLRWFSPDEHHWPTRFRQIWGSAAMVQMHACGMAWGGSLAMSRKLLEGSRLFEIWSESLSDDLSVSTALRESGLKLKFVPAVLTNHEQTTLSDCFEFIRRQLFQVRWHHRNWPLVAGHVSMLMLVIALGWTALAWAILQQNWMCVGLALLGIVGYGQGYVITVRQTERIIRRRLLDQGQTIEPVGYWYQAAHAPMLMIFFASFLSASWIRKINWRGVIYEAISTGHFRKIEDQPSTVEIPLRSRPIKVGETIDRKKQEVPQSN